MVALKTNHTVTKNKMSNDHNFLYGVVTVESFSAIRGQLKEKYKTKRGKMSNRGILSVTLYR